MHSWWWLPPQSIPANAGHDSAPAADAGDVGADIGVLRGRVPSWPTPPDTHPGARGMIPTGRSRKAAAGRDGSAAGPRRSRCQGPLAATEVIQREPPATGDVGG